MLSKNRPEIRDATVDIVASHEEADAKGGAYDGRRYAFYSVWRPLKKVLRDPLALCDPRSIDRERDLVEHVNKQRGALGDYVAGLHMLSGKQAKSQKWYWISEQTEDEVYVIQFYDSHAEKEGRPVGVPHGSPEVQGLDGAEVRESVEVRCLALW